MIVLGNEKGGTGKSTIAMHIIVSLLQKGFKVGSIDTDARQGTLSRYIENRRLRCENLDVSLLVSEHLAIFPSQNENKNIANEQDQQSLKQAFETFKNCDYIVVDTPGNDTFLSRTAHSYANTLITPLNDSFIDLDVLVRVNHEINQLKPSIYAESVWEYRKQRAMRGEKKTIDWIVLRNRLSSLNSKNKEEVKKILEALSKRIAYRLITGFGERVIFRELFLTGLTLLDTGSQKNSLSLSHVAARQELNELLKAMNIIDNDLMVGNQ
jgi:chromosome partitioning protein